MDSNDDTDRALKRLRAQQKAALPTQRERDAIERLIECAKHDTGQSRKCADFLLAWWNGEQNGGFDLADLWGVDTALADDMVTVIYFVRRSRYYPDHWGYKDDFSKIWELWRGPGWKRTYPPCANNS
ncbi:MAG: hypothetical protein FWD67_06800 [Betaproteobacteria bacterium]|nr:hypothetical protein [Betaproteobacteria bacterium]